MMKFYRRKAACVYASGEGKFKFKATKMLSDRFLNFVNYIQPFVCALGISRYTWDPRLNIFVKPSGELLRRNNYLQGANALSYLAWYVLNMYQLWRALQEKNINDTIFELTCIIALTLAYLLLLVTNYWADDWYFSLNAYLLFLRKIDREFLPNHNPNQSKYIQFVDIFCLLILFSMLGLCLITSLFFSYLPTFICLPGSVLPNVWYLFPLIYLLPSYLMFLLCMNFFCVIVTLFIFGVVIIPFMVLELRLGRKTYRSSALLREIPTLQNIYRCCQLLLLSTNIVTGKMLIPLQGLVTTIFVFSGFMVMKHRNILQPVVIAVLALWSVMAPVVYCVMLLVGGYLHSNGKKILGSWKRHQWPSSTKRKEMNKFRLSCSPLMLSYGKAFILRKVSLMIFIRGLTRGMVRALLTLSRGSSKS